MFNLGQICRNSEAKILMSFTRPLFSDKARWKLYKIPNVEH